MGPRDGERREVVDDEVSDECEGEGTASRIACDDDVGRKKRGRSVESMGRSVACSLYLRIVWVRSIRMEDVLGSAETVAQKI